MTEPTPAVAGFDFEEVEVPKVTNIVNPYTEVVSRLVVGGKAVTGPVVKLEGDSQATTENRVKRLLKDAGDARPADQAATIKSTFKDGKVTFWATKKNANKGRTPAVTPASTEAAAPVADNTVATPTPAKASNNKK